MLAATTFIHRLGRVLAAMLLALTTVSTVPAAAQRFDDRDPAYAEFYQALDPHGDWVEHPRYGMTWVPHANDDREWRPYARGQWAYTEEHGWYWESEEEFGWVTYHYGRWLLDERHGWMWVPGREWAPAWVAWRQGEDSIGWAPLPPEAEFAPDGDGAMTFSAYDSPRYSPMWIFVAPAMMTLPSIWRHAYPRARNSMFFGQTRFVTHYSYRDRHIYNRGIDRRFIERRTQRPIPILQVRPMAGPRDVNRDFQRRGGDAGPRHVGVYRPQIAPSPGPGRGGERGPRPSPGFDGSPGGRNVGPRPGFEPGRELPRPGPTRGTDGAPGVPPGPRPGLQQPDGSPGVRQPRPDFQPGSPPDGTRPRPFGDGDVSRRPPMPQQPTPPPQVNDPRPERGGIPGGRPPFAGREPMPGQPPFGGRDPREFERRPPQQPPVAAPPPAPPRPQVQALPPPPQQQPPPAPRSPPPERKQPPQQPPQGGPPPDAPRWQQR